MSHVVTVSTEIKDLEALKKACEEIGLEFKENQKTYRWYGQYMNDYHTQDAAYKHGISPKDYGKCSHAISIKGKPSAYEIGLVKNPNGEGYLMVQDFYDGNIEKAAGKQCYKLYQAYSKQVVTKKVKSKGYIKTKEHVNEEGELEIEYVRY